MPCNLEPNHISIPALQCLVCAMTSNILPPASADVRPVAAVAGASKGEEKQHRAWKGGLSEQSLSITSQWQQSGTRHSCHPQVWICSHSLYSPPRLRNESSRVTFVYFLPLSPLTENRVGTNREFYFHCVATFSVSRAAITKSH